MIAAAAALLAAGLAVLLGLAAAGPVAVLVAAVALLQLLVAMRWFAALDLQAAARTGTLIGAGAALAADLAVALRDDRRPLTPVTAVLGIAMLVAIFGQLIRRDGRERLTASLTATVSLVVAAVMGSCYLGAQSSRDGVPFVVAGVVAAAAAIAAAALPGPPLLGAAAGLAVGTAGGAGVAAASDLGLLTGALVGLGCAITAAVTTAVALRVPRPDPLVTAGLPLLLTAPVVFLLASLLAP
jgi:hypothetical protein